MWTLFCFAAVISLQYAMAAGCPEVVSRKDWDAVNSVHVKYLTRPVKLVVIQHTVSRPCSTDDECKKTMQAIQDYQIDKLKFSDIGSSFYVGGNGKIYEGRGWLYIGAHTLGYNTESIGISFIGDYNKIAPTNAQLDAVKDFLRCGVEEGHLMEDYRVVGHKQLVATESPGRQLYNAIRKWPEWLEDVSSIKS